MTRATGKAYRLPLGWLMSAAGYSPCPAEEMDYDQPTEAKTEPVATPQPKVEEQSEAPKMATVKQKTELLLLLNNQAISEEEKEKMIVNINKLTEDRATEAIRKLKHRIKKFEVANH